MPTFDERVEIRDNQGVTRIDIDPDDRKVAILGGGGNSIVELGDLEGPGDVNLIGNLRIQDNDGRDAISLNSAGSAEFGVDRGNGNVYIGDGERVTIFLRGGEGVIEIRGSRDDAGGRSIIFRDQRNTPTIHLDGATGNITLQGDIVVNGRTVFSSSGRIVVPAGATIGTQTGLALSTSASLIATLQQDLPSVIVRAAVPDAAAGKVTVHLNQAPEVDVTVGWMAVDNE